MTNDEINVFNQKECRMDVRSYCKFSLKHTNLCDKCDFNSVKKKTNVTTKQLTFDDVMKV